MTFFTSVKNSSAINFVFCSSVCGEVWAVGAHVVRCGVWVNRGWACGGHKVHVYYMWAVYGGCVGHGWECGEVWAVGEHVVRCVVRCGVWANRGWACGGHGGHRVHVDYMWAICGGCIGHGWACSEVWVVMLTGLVIRMISLPSLPTLYTWVAM